jgi:hypothetical protein
MVRRLDHARRRRRNVQGCPGSHGPRALRVRAGSRSPMPAWNDLHAGLPDLHGSAGREERRAGTLVARRGQEDRNDVVFAFAAERLEVYSGARGIAPPPRGFSAATLTRKDGSWSSGASFPGRYQRLLVRRDRRSPLLRRGSTLCRPAPRMTVRPSPRASSGPPGPPPRGHGLRSRCRRSLAVRLHPARARRHAGG